jgi:hypothetical protein
VFERRSQPLLPLRDFAFRVFRNFGIAMSLIVGSLAIGMIGYRATEGLSWLDAFMNASMILTGMGPVSALHTTAAKVFASCYALFSGIVFLSTVAVLLAPIAHRMLHRFHLEIDSEASGV